MSANIIKLISGARIGELCAEDDLHYLRTSFVEKPQLSQLLDLDTNASILLGRTGAGKSAIMNAVQGQEDVHIRSLDLETLFFQHVSNSNTFKFFTGLGTNLDIVFALLWKHVLLVEGVKLYFANRPAFEIAIGKSRVQRRNLKKYIDKWESDFWSDTEEVMREVISKFEAELRLKAGIDLKQLIALGYEGAMKVSEEQKTQIMKNIQEVVNTSLASSLHAAISDLNELTKTKQQKYYLTLDELDEDWVSVELKYKLIRALLEAIKKFRKVRRVKILIALRTDLYERSIKNTSRTGYQSEKYSGFLVPLTWSRDELFNLVEKRLQELFKWKYTPNKLVSFYDIFPAKIRGKTATFEYLIERTLMRPRDLIEFVNQILEANVGQVIDVNSVTSQKISAKSVASAEATYSSNRKTAVIEEWAPTMHPQIQPAIDIVLNLKQNFNFNDETVGDRLEEVALEICTLDDVPSVDEMRKKADLFVKNTSEQNAKALKREIFSVLYKVGILHIKLSDGSGFRKSFETISAISVNQVDQDTKFRIDPTFWRALSITPNIT